MTLWRGPAGREHDGLGPPTPASSHRRRSLGRGQEARLGEVGGVGETGGLSDHHPDSGPRSRPEDSSSMRRSSRMAELICRSSAKTSAMSPPLTREAERTRSSTSDSISGGALTPAS